MNVLDCVALRRLVRDAFDSAIKVEPYELGCEVTLPILDPLNDFIKIYVVQTSVGLVLTDYGTVLESLLDFGVDLSSGSERANAFDSILISNGVQTRDGVLQTNLGQPSDEEFQRRLRLYARAIAGVLDLEVTARHRISLDFEGVVWSYLQENRIPHLHHVPVHAPPMEHVFVEFSIGAKGLLDTVSAGQVSTAGSILNRIIVDFERIRKFHRQKYVLAAIYNDESPVAESPRFQILEETVDLPPIPWKKRESGLRELAIASEA